MAFGHALRRAVCTMGPRQPCATCPHRHTCVYTRLFEPVADRRSETPSRRLRTGSVDREGGRRRETWDILRAGGQPDAPTLARATSAAPETRTQGESSFWLGRLDPARAFSKRACFLRAIEVARRQDAKSLELRAATSLARLLKSRAREGEARRILDELYSWFTEGHDTRDLRQTADLLASLS